MDTSFELEGGQMKTNQSNETTLKVISIKIMGLSDTKNKYLARSGQINFLSLHYRQN